MMNKLKLFSKTYIFTMGIISLIILISNVLIYLALPKVYVNNKQKEADKIIEALIEQVNKSDNEESFKIAKNFAEKYNIQVLLTIGDEKRVFQAGRMRGPGRGGPHHVRRRMGGPATGSDRSGSDP